MIDNEPNTTEESDIPESEDDTHVKTRAIKSRHKKVIDLHPGSNEDNTDSDAVVMMAATMRRERNKHRWILDSGATFHMTPNQDQLHQVYDTNLRKPSQNSRKRKDENQRER
jgi:hypothetical protein